MALEFLIDAHEFFFGDSQAVQNIESFIAIFADVAENSLSKVLNHVFCLSLLPFLAAFISFLITILMSLFRGAIYLAFKLDILERFLEGEVSGGLLYDANIIFGGFEVWVCV